MQEGHKTAVPHADVRHSEVQAADADVLAQVGPQIGLFFNVHRAKLSPRVARNLVITLIGNTVRTALNNAGSPTIQR